ncbi:hypothetical protein, partial [Nocardia abscessus]|uniref:hypothetical protein n=1 Tax=Nocardia abscessus TaxID=120957 RepID=UPI0024565FBC
MHRLLGAAGIPGGCAIRQPRGTWTSAVAVGRPAPGGWGGGGAGRRGPPGGGHTRTKQGRKQPARGHQRDALAVQQFADVHLHVGRRQAA